MIAPGISYLLIYHIEWTVIYLKIKWHSLYWWPMHINTSHTTAYRNKNERQEWPLFILCPCIMSVPFWIIFFFSFFYPLLARLSLLFYRIYIYVCALTAIVDKRMQHCRHACSLWIKRKQHEKNFRVAIVKLVLKPRFPFCQRHW